MQNIGAKIFISCGQSNPSEQKIAREICEKLKNLNYEPYLAIEQQTLKGLKENIFNELITSEYFLFIDFKREKFLNTNSHRGSLFSHQELAMASFLNLDIIAFQEKGIKKLDGILQFMQTNCLKFNSRKKLSQDVIKKVKKKWSPNWKNELTIDASNPPYGQTTIKNKGGIPGRFYHLTINNKHYNKHAKNCLGYLERIYDCTKKEEIHHQSIEFKWEGYRVLPNATILSKSYRKLDAFYITWKRKPKINFNIFADSSDMFPKIKLPGKYDLTYVIISDNFRKVGARFRLLLDKDINKIVFKKLEDLPLGLLPSLPIAN